MDGATEELWFSSWEGQKIFYFQSFNIHLESQSVDAGVTFLEDRAVGT